MKRIIDWLKSMFKRRAFTVVDNQADDPENVTPDEYTIDAPSRAEVAASLHGREIEQDESTATVPHLEVLDLDLSDTDKKIGIDPYDTAQMHKK